MWLHCYSSKWPKTSQRIKTWSCEISLWRYFQLIFEIYDTSVKLLTTGDLMYRFFGTLTLPRDVQKAATHIPKKAVDWWPISVAAAAIYMASQASNDKRPQREIAEIAAVADVTIRQSYKLVLPRAKDLFPKDFQVYHTHWETSPELNEVTVWFRRRSYVFTQKFYKFNFFPVKVSSNNTYISYLCF